MTDNFWNTLRKPQYNRETTRNNFFHHKKRWYKPLLKFQLIALRAAFSIGSPTRVSSRKVSEWQLANTRIVLTGISDIGWISWLPLVKIFNLSISVSTERQKLIFFQNSKRSLKKSSKSWYQKNLEKNTYLRGNTGSVSPETTWSNSDRMYALRQAISAIQYVLSCNCQYYLKGNWLIFHEAIISTMLVKTK